MNEVDNGSLTPPLSPYGFTLEDVPSPPIVEEIDTEEHFSIPCFTCCGEVTTRGDNFHTDGFWKSNFLGRLAILEIQKCQYPIPTGLSSSFGYLWSDNLQTNDLDKIFLLLRQHVGEIQTLAARSRLVFDSGGHLATLKEKRVQINGFLLFLLEYLVRSSELSDAWLETLVHHLHTLLLHLDRLSELPAHVRQDPAEGANTRGSACHLSFHLTLDINLRMLSIFHVLQVKYTGFRYSSRFSTMPEEDVSYSLYEQLLHSVLWDLISLAKLRYLTKVMNQEYTRTCMFSCTCVREMWILLLKLTEYRASNNMAEVFWIHLHHVIKSVCDMDKDNTTSPMEVEDSRVLCNPPESFHVEDPVSLSLWTLYSVAQLYAEKSQLSYKGEGAIVDNYHDLQTILKKLLISQPNVSESVLRRHLRACLQVTSLWEPNTSILIILWDHFYKKLNQNDLFQTGTSIMDGLACIDQTVASLYDKCQNWAQAPLDNIEKDTSYQLFLRILALHLGKLYQTGCTQEWKQIKGRIYSKFHPRRVRELMESGLYNLTCLFVTLAMTTDLEDVASKLCDFYNMLDIDKISCASRSMVWRGAFTLMLVYESRQVDISFLADKMVSAFSSCVSDFKTAGIDTRHSLWKLIVTYLDGVQEVVNTSTQLQTSEHKLICAGIKSLMTICSENELRSVLATLLAVMSKFGQLVANLEDNSVGPFRHSLQHTEFAGQLWRTVYPFICEHAQTLTPSPHLSNIAAQFCILVISFPPLESTGSNETFLSIFKYFTINEKVTTSVSCTFLCNLLLCQRVREQLQQQYQHESIIIRAWIRCFLQVPAGSQLLADVTREVLKLRDVRSIFEEAEMDLPDDTEIATVQFLKAVEKAHRNKQSWEDKMKFQRNVLPYFSDIPKYISSPGRGSSEAISVMYRMVGYILKYCSKLIYVQQDMIIPSIISTMVVPHSVMNPDKPINPGLLSALRDTLHLYIQGLGKLAYDRDPFIQRRLKDIVQVYLPRFSLQSPTSSMMTSSAVNVHPVVASLSGSFIQQPLEEAVSFRHHLMSLVVSHFLTVKNFTIHPSHSVGMAFLYDILQRTTSSRVKSSDLFVVLGPCLEYLLLLPDHSVLVPCIVSVLQRTAEPYKQHTDIEQPETVTDVVQKFTSTYFKFSMAGVIKVLEKLAVLLPNCVIRVIQLLSKSVLEIENKRGVGLDHNMRNKYYSLLRLLGEEGQSEIARLEGK